MVDGSFVGVDVLDDPFFSGGHGDPPLRLFILVGILFADDVNGTVFDLDIDL